MNLRILSPQIVVMELLINRDKRNQLRSSTSQKETERAKRTNERWGEKRGKRFPRRGISFDLTPASRSRSRCSFSTPLSYWLRRVSVARDSTVVPHSSHAPCLETLA
ncbi:uncharacterized protein LOC113464140 [Ceratina calcarata]|uniref:Uncharacterized protein LOC113464140 n=1 Tax=Ceratina calcarata TaxID=156304 RepID=A0AAJ7W9K7_9HYME|nr:uncharacterized protein LOC113464140 [Ceratina calcarata]